MILFSFSANFLFRSRCTREGKQVLIQAAHGPDGVVVGQFFPCELRQGGAGCCAGKVLFGGGYHAALLRPDALHQDPVRPRGRKLPSGMVLPLLLFDFPTG